MSSGQEELSGSVIVKQYSGLTKDAVGRSSVLLSQSSGHFLQKIRNVKRFEVLLGLEH